MGHRTSPTLLRMNQIFTSRSSSVSLILPQLASKHVHEDYQIRELASQVFPKYIITNIYIERVMKSTILIHVETTSPNLLSGENNVNIETFKRKLNRIIKYPKIHVSLLMGNEWSGKAILNRIVQAIESANSTTKATISYQTVIRNSLNLVATSGNYSANPNVLGIAIRISGRLNGATIASEQTFTNGVLGSQTLTNNVQYYSSHAMTKTGLLGVQVRINLAVRDLRGAGIHTHTVKKDNTDVNNKSTVNKFSKPFNNRFNRDHDRRSSTNSDHDRRSSTNSDHDRRSSTNSNHDRRSFTSSNDYNSRRSPTNNDRRSSFNTNTTENKV